MAVKKAETASLRFFLSSALHRRNFNIQIAQREAAARVDKVEIQVGSPAVFHLLGGEDLALVQAGMAPAALTGAAVRRRGNAVFLQGLEDGIGRAGRDRSGLAADMDRNLNRFRNGGVAYAISSIYGRIVMPVFFS